MHNQPFNLDRIDYKAVLKKRRKKLLIWSAPPVAIVFLLALWFVLPTLLTHQAIGAYKKAAYSSSRSWLTPLTWSSPEPFVAAFDSGTVDTRLGQYERAEKELTRALALAPKDKVCMAAQNLVASLKAHGSAIKDKAKEVKQLQAKANIVIKAHPDCFVGSASQGGGGGSGQAQSDSQAPSEAQQQQLEQKEQEGRERKAKYATEEEYDPSNPKIKPW
jgi:tetratricopeptide (TPR) repeat protein